MQTSYDRPNEGFLNRVRLTVEDWLNDYDSTRLATATLLGLICD